jgi:iron complex outermembrane receptor protein
MDRKHYLLVSVAAFCLSAAAAPAFAQSTPAAPPASTSDKSSTTTVKEVVITGVRQSVLNAQKIKKDSDQVMDSIVAEDVNKLPDDNVAEALQRVTGVQITRNADEGSSVVIRGLPQVITLLNGRDLFTTTGRYVALADIPAAFLQKVDVYKSNEADMMEGGIAGTIDVRMHRPFDFPGLEVSASGRDIYSSLSHRQDPNAAVLISDRWQTPAGQFGALIGLSYQERHYRNEIIDNFVQEGLLTAPPSVGNPTGNWAGSGPTPTNVFFANNIGQQEIQGDRRRPAANFALQWRPNDELELYAEGFYTEDSIRYSTEFFVGLPNNTPSPPYGGITSYTLYPGSSNEAQSITSQNAFSIASTQAFQADSQTYQVATGGTWKRGQLKVTTDLAYTESIYKIRTAILDTSFFTPNVYASSDYQNSGTPYLSYTGADLDNPANYDLFQLFDDYDRDHGDSLAWSLDGTYTFDGGFLKYLKAGFRYENRTAESQSTNPSSHPYAFNSIPVTSIPGLETTTPGDFFEGDAQTGVRQWATPNPDFLLNNTNSLRALLGYQGEPAFDPANYFSDDETTYAGYLMGKGQLTVASRVLDIVAGVRLVDTTENLNGFNVVNNTALPGCTATLPTTCETATPLAINKTNFDVLPSLSLKYNVADDLIARFAVSRSATRPNFADLKPAISITSAGATLLGTGSGGNPNLQEVTSNNFDAALEWYFARTGSLTGTVFYRDIDGYVQYYGVNQTIGGQTYNVTQPFNTGAGRLEGLELAYTQFYDFLPSWLRGLGSQVNFTYIDGVTHQPAAVETAANTFGRLGAITGVSTYSLNAIGLYDLGPFFGRVAYNWRSKYVDSYNDGGAIGPNNVVVAPLSFLDMSFGYRATPKLTFTFDWVNALGTVYHDAFGGSPDFPRDTRRYDETMELGFRWRL